MNQWAALAKLEKERGKPEDRKYPRFVAHSFNCAKGVVTDFSASGLRISYKKDMKFRVGQLVDLELYLMKGMHQCEAQVMWAKRVSRKQHDVGFRFTDPNTHKHMKLFECGYDPLSETLLERFEKDT
tara:strand:- start:3702 stop:4082 length:381 start_codon:yes stop_codon:yes gene_type:complete